MNTKGKGSAHETLSLGDLDESALDKPLPRPFLFQVFCAADLAGAPVARYGLDLLDRVTIGRGGDWERKAGGKALDIRVRDDWASSAHCLLERQRLSWVLSDLDSRNGTRVNGERTSKKSLVDGDVIEVGRSFFLFRDRRPALAEDGKSSLTLEPGEAKHATTTLLPGLQRAFGQLTAIATSNTEIILTGPTGTGKDMVANEVHRLSVRPGPFVAVNCAALPEALVESELFGASKGAFSGAISHRPGLIESADKGTLFLDEVGDLPLAAQTKLLRALEEKQIRRVGATSTLPVDFRVVAATHKDLRGMVRNGEFREDLLARLQGYCLALPPLAARREDLGLLLRAWVRQGGEAETEPDFSSAVARLLFSFSWPQNIRQLFKTLSRARAVASRRTLRLEDLPDDLAAPHAAEAAPTPSQVSRLSSGEEQQRDAIVQALRIHSGNVSAVARALGKHRTQVQRWIKRYEIDVHALSVPESDAPDSGSS